MVIFLISSSKDSFNLCIAPNIIYWTEKKKKEKKKETLPLGFNGITRQLASLNNKIICYH